MIVCQCEVVSDRQVEAALLDGAHTVSAVCRTTGAATQCGTCVFSIKAQVCAHHDREAERLVLDGAAS